MKNKCFKKLFLNFFIIAILFIGINNVFAENKKVTFNNKEYEYDDSKAEALYCGKEKGFYYQFLWFSGDFDQCIKVSKEDPKENPDIPDTVKFSTNLVVDKLAGEHNMAGYVITTKSDDVYKEKDKWWRTIQVCYSNAFFNGSLVLFPDILSVTTEQFKNIVSRGECLTLTVRDIDSDKLVSSCPKLIEKYSKIELYEQEYKKNNNPTYINKYKEELEEIKGLCMEVLKFSDWNEACTDACLNLSENIHAWNNSFDVSDKTECGFSARLIAWIINIIKWIKYIIPVAVIVLGMLDFIKATGSDKDDEMKKAQGRFVKRLIAAALIFLVPLIIEFVLPKLGFDYNSCGLF